MSRADLVSRLLAGRSTAAMQLEALLMMERVAKPRVEPMPRPRAGSQTCPREEPGLPTQGAVEMGRLKDPAELGTRPRGEAAARPRAEPVPRPPAASETRAREEAAARPRAEPVPRPPAELETQAREEAVERAQVVLATRPAAEPRAILQPAAPQAPQGAGGW